MHGRVEPVVIERRTSASVAVVGVAIAAVAASLVAAPDARGAVGAALAIITLAIAAVDARSFIIPNQLNAAGLALAFVHAAVRSPDMMVEAVAIAALRGVVLGLAFLAVRSAYRWLREREGIGLGDVKLAVVAGAWVDWTTMPVVIEIAALAALAVYALRRVRMGRSMLATNRLPFGLFFAPAIWLGWLMETTAIVPF